MAGPSSGHDAGLGDMDDVDPVSTLFVLNVTDAVVAGRMVIRPDFQGR